MGIFKSINKVTDVVGQFVEDKDQANTIASEVVKIELGGNWFQRSWRPITALTFVYIIFNNLVILPYLRALGVVIPEQEIPTVIWSGLFGCLGGFIGLRSVVDKRR